MSLVRFRVVPQKKEPTRRVGSFFWLLAIGHWPLAVGHWLWDIGFWLLAFGYWTLAVGFWLLGFGCGRCFTRARPRTFIRGSGLAHRRSAVGRSIATRAYARGAGGLSAHGGTPVGGPDGQALPALSRNRNATKPAISSMPSAIAHPERGTAMGSSICWSSSTTIYPSCFVTLPLGL